MPESEHEGKCADEREQEPCERHGDKGNRDRRLVIAGRDQKEQVADREECHRGRGHRQDHIPFLEDRQYKKGYQRNKAEEPADPSHIVDDHGKVIEPLHVR